MSKYIPDEVKKEFERQGLPAVRKIAEGIHRVPSVGYAIEWVKAEEKRIAAEERNLSVRSVLAAESQADSAKESARQARASSVAAWVAAVVAIVSALLAFLVAARG